MKRIIEDLEIRAEKDCEECKKTVFMDLLQVSFSNTLSPALFTK